MYSDIVILDHIARLRAAKGQQPTDEFFDVLRAEGVGGEISTRIIGIEIAVLIDKV